MNKYLSNSSACWPQTIYNSWSVVWKNTNIREIFLFLLAVEYVCVSPCVTAFLTPSDSALSEMNEKDLLSPSGQRLCGNLGHSLTPCRHPVMAARLLLIQLRGWWRSQESSFPPHTLLTNARTLPKTCLAREGCSEEQGSDIKCVIPRWQGQLWNKYVASDCSWAGAVSIETWRWEASSIQVNLKVEEWCLG